MTMKSEMMCEEIYDAIIQLDERSYDLFGMAVCFLRGYDPEKLRSMLTSSDLGIVDAGLFIAGEIGSLAGNYVGEFRALVKSDDTEISRRASKLLDVYGRSNAPG